MDAAFALAVAIPSLEDAVLGLRVPPLLLFDDPPGLTADPSLANKPFLKGVLLVAAKDEEVGRVALELRTLLLLFVVGLVLLLLLSKISLLLFR